MTAEANSPLEAPPTVPSHRATIISSYVGLLVIGIAMNVIGPVLPVVVRELNLSLALAGTILSGRAVGRLVGTPTGGFMSDRVGRKPVVVVGACTMSLGLLLSGLVPGKVNLILWSFVVGVGIGQVDGSLNALVADLSPNRRGFALNMLHVFFGVGALLGPIGAGLMIQRWSSWQLVLYVAAGFCLAFALLMAAQSIPAPSPTAKRSGGVGALRLLLTDTTIALLALVMFCYGGAGFGITGWVNSYLARVLGFAALASSSVLSLYNVGLTSGRLVCSVVADRIGFPRLMAACAIGSFVALGVAVSTHSGPVTVAGFWMTGFFFSGLFPTSIAWASSRYPDRAGAASSTLITMNNVGAILVPQAMGAIGDRWGLGAGMRLAWWVLWLLAAVGITLFVRDARQRRAKAQVA